MRLSHPIFHRPLDPRIELEAIDTPDGYRIYPEGKHLPDQLLAWTVHEGKFPKVDVGMVSDPVGFEDTPDTEWISSGVNSKGPRSVALGRQANFFLWGFYGAPDRMTPSAKRVFLNTIVYMKQFDGRTPLARKVSQGRERIRQMLGFLPQLLERADESTRQYLERAFPKKALEHCGLDADKLDAYLSERIEYVTHTDGQFVIDADLEQLAVPNRSPAFFAAVLARLVVDPKDPVALRLIERYVPVEYTGAEAFARWYAENQHRLYFSDTAGYRWFLRPTDRDQEPVEESGR